MYKLYEGDCLEIMQGMEDQSVGAIITDPPYNLSRSSINAFQREFERICCGRIIVFCPPENQWFPSDFDVEPLQYHFWIKPISTKNTSKNAARFVEMIQIMGEGAWNHERHWSQYNNVHTDIVETTLFHPYAKPLSLMERLVLNYTNLGDIVCDPFMGSGSTGVACKRVHRNFIGIELEHEYFLSAKARVG